MRVLALLLLAGCAAARSATPEARAPQVESEDARPRPDQAVWHVHVDAGGKTLGAYVLVLRFNPQVAVIEEIQPCAVRRFRGAPDFDPATFRSGTTRVVALDTHPARPADEEYHLLTVTFRRVAPGTLRAAAEIEKAYDGENKPLPGRVTLPRFEHSFR